MFKGSVMQKLAFAVCTFVLLMAPNSYAEEFPTKDLKFLVWTAAGSSLDAMARSLSVGLEKDLGKNIVVDNRPGGSGAVAMSMAMAQPANGYTLIANTSSLSFTLAKGTTPFKAEDFIMLRAVQAEPSSIAVLKDSPIKTLDDFIKQMKADPTKLRVGGYASAGFNQFVYYKLQQAAGFKGAWIPFDGGNKAALALLGGHLDVAAMTPSSALAQVESGEIRLLGISSKGRSAYFPDVPTYAELGYPIEEYIWRGVMVKKDTPKEIVDRLGKAIDFASNTEEWKNINIARKQEKTTYTSEELNAKVAQEVKERIAFLKHLGLLK